MVLFHTVALMIEYPGASLAAPKPEYWDQVERDAARQMETLAASLQNEHLRVEVKTFRGFPIDGILIEAERMHADLIAIGSVGRSGVSRFLIGSVAEAVLHRATCSVLTARKPDLSDPIGISAA
jgi:nucleotide-binding universal stress UspA family protein